MVGFKLQAPIDQLTAEQVAQLGLASFRPPGVKSVPSGPGFNMPSGGGGDSGLGAGVAALGKGLGALGKMGGGRAVGANAMTNAPAFGAGLGSSGQGVLADAHNQWLAQNAGDPSIAGYGSSLQSGGGFWDFLSSIFSSGGGSSAAGGLGSSLTDAGSWGGSIPDFPAAFARGGKVVPHFFGGGMSGFSAPDIKPFAAPWGGQDVDLYDPGSLIWGNIGEVDNPEGEDDQGEGIGRGVGGMAGSMIGSIWGPIGQMAGREIGQKVGGGIGAAVQGNWNEVGENLVEGTPLDFIFNRGGAVPNANMVPPSASPSRGAVADDVSARLKVGEFVVPDDVTAWRGEKFMQDMIDAARAEMANRTAAPQMGLAPETPPTFLSEGARKGGRHA